MLILKVCYNKPKWLDIEEYKKLKQETDTKVENYRVQYNKCGDFSSLVLSDLRKPINA